MNTAKKLIETFPDFTICLTEADKIAEATEQDFENETTIFKFEDGSKLFFDGIGHIVKEI